MFSMILIIHHSIVLFLSYWIDHSNSILYPCGFLIEIENWNRSQIGQKILKWWKIKIDSSHCATTTDSVMRNVDDLKVVRANPLRTCQHCRGQSCAQKAVHMQGGIIANNTCHYWVIHRHSKVSTVSSSRADSLCERKWLYWLSCQ